MTTIFERMSLGAFKIALAGDVKHFIADASEGIECSWIYRLPLQSGKNLLKKAAETGIDIFPIFDCLN